MLSMLAGIVSVFSELLVFDYYSSNQWIEQNKQTSRYDKLHTSISYDNSSVTHKQSLIETPVLKSSTKDLHQTHPMISNANPSVEQSVVTDTSETDEVEVTIGIKRRFSIENLDETEPDLSINAMNSQEFTTPTTPTIEPSVSIIYTPYSSTRCNFIIVDNSRMLNGVHTEQIEVEHSPSAETKNKGNSNNKTRIPAAHNLHQTTQHSNNNDNSTTFDCKPKPNEASIIQTSSFKRKKHLQNDCYVDGRSKRSSYCITQLFHPKSIVHIHNEENRLFSIACLPTSQKEEGLLAQRTEECVDQIFDLMTHNTGNNNTNLCNNNECQAELVLPLYTKSQLIKIHAMSNSF